MVGREILVLVVLVRVQTGQWFDAGLHLSVQAFAHHSLRRTILSKRASASASKANMWYLYITKNRDGSFYTGITENLKRRFEEHRRGKGGHYTKYNPPVGILYNEEFESKEEAEKREQQIKRWSRAKKKSLIEKDFDKSRKLSISRD